MDGTFEGDLGRYGRDMDRDMAGAGWVLDYSC